MRDNQSVSSSSALGTEQLIELIRVHQPVPADEVVRLLSNVLPVGLTETQKLACIHNQLRHLVDIGQIRNKGSRRYPKWGLA